MAKFRPTFARESKRRTRARSVSPVTERRRARRAARDKCKAEQRRLVTAIPAERKRVDGVIAQIRASARQAAAQVIAQGAEAVRLEREDLRKRITGWRKDAKLGKCVDMTAGPAIFQYAYPKRPAHLKRGGQSPLFSQVPVPAFGGGRIGDPFRVRGQQFADEKRALAAVLAHLVHDQGGIVVLEQWNGAAYVDGPMYGLEGEGKAATLIELDPLDPHGHQRDRAKRHSQFGAGLRSILPSSIPPARVPAAPYRNVPFTREQLVTAFKRAVKFHDRAYVASLIAELGLPLEQGKEALLQLHRERRWVTLSRLDLVQAVPAELRTLHQKSLIKYLSATFDLAELRDDARRGQLTAKEKRTKAASGRLKGAAGKRARKPKGKIRQRAYNVDGTRKPRLKNLTPPPPRPSSRPAPTKRTPTKRKRASSRPPQYAGAGPTTGTRQRMLPPSSPAAKPKPKRKAGGARTLLALKTTQREGKHGLAADWSFTWDPRNEEGKVVIPFNHRGSARVATDRSVRPVRVWLYAYMPQGNSNTTSGWDLGDPETMTFPDLIAAVKAALKRPADSAASRSMAYVDKR